MLDVSSLMATLANNEGYNSTLLAGVSIFKQSKVNNREQSHVFHYQQGLLLVGQGAERIFYKGQRYEYNTENYLALTLPITANYQVVTDKGAAMLAMVVEFDLALLQSVITVLQDLSPDVFDQSCEAQGLFLSSRTPAIDGCLKRLLRALQCPVETRILGESLLKELYLRVLLGQNGHYLVELTRQNSQLSKVDKALKWMHSQYHQKMDIKSLAGLVNMSPVTFHRAFKALTAQSPMQYLKSLRLNQAKEMLQLSGCNVATAANQVGYDSASQFSREFKRAYGITPKSVLRQSHGT